MEKLIHLLIPRESNNHKAKILHSSSLIALASFVIMVQAFISFLPRLNPNILGYAANIAPSEVVRLTNERRAVAGLPPLTYNQSLASAAYTKGQDMINRDYWAHVAPDGTQPWKFITDFGYRYRYAGENLARDFSNASSAVDAWMNSPTHRDNILNSKYKEIGIGVVEGDLAGSDTTIIVQFFGTTYADVVNQPVAASSTEVKAVVTKAVQTPIATAKPIEEKVVTAFVKPTGEDAVIESPKPSQEVLVSPFNVTRTVSIAVVGLLLLVFVVDAILVSKRRIVRIAGRTFSHVAFLMMLLAIILILKSGKII